MTRDQLSLAADILGIISGILAIAGIGGLLSWSIFHPGRPLSERVLEVFAYSIKTFLCVILLLIIYQVAIQFWMFIVDNTWGRSQSYFNLVKYAAWWDYEYFFAVFFSVENIFGTILTIIGFVPLYAILAVCIYRWSLDPLRALRRKITNT